MIWSAGMYCLECSVDIIVGNFAPNIKKLIMEVNTKMKLD